MTQGTLGSRTAALNGIKHFNKIISRDFWKLIFDKINEYDAEGVSIYCDFHHQNPRNCAGSSFFYLFIFIFSILLGLNFITNSKK